jgi:FixJ family two-component response regulator
MITGSFTKPQQGRRPTATVFVVDDDPDYRDGLSSLFRSVDLAAATFASVPEFIEAPRSDGPGCLVVDVRLPCLSGLEFQSQMARFGIDLPIILMTGHGDIPMSVQAMKAGAVDFLTKPFRDQDMLHAVSAGLELDVERRRKHAASDRLTALYGTLTPREREIFAQVTAGLMNKQIANHLGLSEVTVKIHRGHMVRKLNARSLVDLVQMRQVLDLPNSD